jgi:hypothetical protein
MTEQQTGREVAVIPAAPREIATTDTDSWAQIMQPVVWLAERIAGTEFVPRNLRNSTPAVTAAILYGREVGLPPMTALTQTHVIEGKPSMSAEAMRAMILAAGHDLVFEESTGAVCTMRARRRDSEHWTRLSWSIDMARAAGVTGKDNWKKYPRAMLVARCTTDLARMVFPDVIHGFRSVEEVEDLGGSAPDEAGGAEAPTGTTKVARKRAAKKAAPAPAAKATPAALPAGPPLPGEPGYDDTTTEPAGEVESDEHGEATRDATSGEGSDDYTSPASDSPGSADLPASPVAEPPAADPGDQTGEGGESVPDAGESRAQGSAARSGDDPSSPEKPNPRPIGRGQQRAYLAQFGGFGLKGDGDRDERLNITSTIVGREIGSSNDLTHAEASQVMDTLARCETRERLYELLDNIDQARAADAAAEAGDDPA